MTTEEAKQWREMIEGYRNRVTEIRISTTMEPAQVKDVLARCDSLYSEIRIMYGDVLKRSKEVERWIYRLENKNKTGNNEGSRRNTMVTAVENAPRGDGTTVNLYDIEIEVNNQVQDLSALIDIIKAKSSMCITLNGLLKVESMFA